MARRAAPRIDESLRARSALVAAGLGAAIVGLLGVDGGLLWVVAGVWTVRSASGSPVGVAWGLAVLGAGVRWGGLDLAGLQVATRLFGPTVGAGTAPVRIASAVAFAAAAVDELRSGGLRASSRAEQAASVVAIVALTATFLVPGSTEISATIAWWALGGAAFTAASMGAAGLTRSVPAVVPVVLAAAGVAVMVVAS